MYTPTKQELEEMGYTYHKEREKFEICLTKYVTIHYDAILHQHYIGKNTTDRGVIYIYIFPESKQDIETLIRLFTPNK